MSRRMRTAIFATSLLIVSAAWADAPIMDGAFEPITKSSSPKLFKQWGKQWVDRFNVSLENAVRLTAKSSGCDSVWMSGVSFEKSVVKKEFTVFAQCSNEKQFFYTEQEANEGTASVSQASKLENADEAKLILQCRDLAKEQLMFKSTMDISVLSTNVTRADHVISIAMPFEAKNALGNSLPYVAHCSFNGDQMRLLSVKED